MDSRETWENSPDGLFQAVSGTLPDPCKFPGCRVLHNPPEKSWSSLGTVQPWLQPRTQLAGNTVESGFTYRFRAAWQDPERISGAPEKLRPPPFAESAGGSACQKGMLRPTACMLDRIASKGGAEVWGHGHPVPNQALEAWCTVLQKHKEDLLSQDIQSLARILFTSRLAFGKENVVLSAMVELIH